MQRLGFEGRVRVENIAVTDGGTEYVSLYAGRNKAREEWNVIGHDVAGRTSASKLKVRACSLDSYFSSRDRIDFVKIDIEGAEDQALRGMRRVLREQKPLLLIEFHNDVGWAGREELYEAGYELFNMQGEQIVRESDSPRVYHCLARHPQNAV
jgi:FkbM family methyltransferase